MKKLIIISIALLIGGAASAQVNTDEIPHTKFAKFVKSNVDGLPAIPWPMINRVGPGTEYDQRGVINTPCIIEKMKPDAKRRNTIDVRYTPERMKPY